MKLGWSLLFAAVCAEELTEAQQLNYVEDLLDELESYCQDAYAVPAPRTKPNESRSQWNARWTARCTKQRDRIWEVFQKKTPKGVPCGTFTTGYEVNFPIQPPARAPCAAFSDVSSEFKRFINAFLTNDGVCPEARRLRLDQRMKNWEQRLVRRSDCNSYQYKVPFGDWYKISNLCDADFEESYDTYANCTTYAENNWCNQPATFYVPNRMKRTSNGFETGLNCPECGCAGSPISLYDVPLSEAP